MPVPRAGRGSAPLADHLAESLVRAVADQRRAGQVLHDHVGPLLSAAGLRLQLLRMDFPDSVGRVREVMDALDDAMERVRALSQELNPSPVYRAGLKNALADLIDQHRQGFPGRIVFEFSTSLRLPVEAAVAMYEAAAVAIAEAAQHGEATRIKIGRASCRER